MGVDALGEAHDSHNLAVALGVFHYERLRNFSGCELAHFPCHFLRKLRHLEAGGAVVGVFSVVHHYAVAQASVFILRDKAHGVFERQRFLVHDVGAHAVEACDSIHEIFFGNLGAQEYVACVDAVAALLNKLYYVEAVFGLYDFRHLLGVIEVEGHCCIFGHELSAAHEAELAAAHTRAGVFGVEDSHSGKFTLATGYAVGVVAQTCLDVVDFLTRNYGVQSQKLNLYLQRYEGDTVGWKLREVAAHVGGSRLYVFCERLAYLLHAGAVAHVFHIVFAYFGERLAEVLLHLFARAEVAYEIVHLLVDLHLYHRLLYLHSVYVGLMQKQALYGNLLGYKAIRVSGNAEAVALHLLIGFLDFRFIDWLVANHPGHFFDNVAVACGKDACGEYCRGGC